METLNNTDVRRDLSKYATAIASRRVDGYVLRHGGGLAPTDWGIMLPMDPDGTVLVPQGVEIRRVRRKG